VNEICDRIIVINEGRLAAVDSPDNLKKSMKKSSSIIVKLRKEGDASGAGKIISQIPGVISATADGSSGEILTFTIETEPDMDLRPRIVKLMVEGDYPLLEIYNRELSLEDIFLHLVTSEN
jgi:ABC-2 type transport system ATP-binding protein